MKLIAAVSESGIIGIKDTNNLPWSIPADLAHFKRLTMGQTVVMGYGTFESMWCKPLANRYNVILTTTKFLAPENTIFINSIESIIENYNESWLIGGASMYQQLINNCDELHLTIVPEKFVMPAKEYVKFPWINPLKFKVRSTEPLKNCIMEKIC